MSDRDTKADVTSGPFQKRGRRPQPRTTTERSPRLPLHTEWEHTHMGQEGDRSSVVTPLVCSEERRKTPEP